MPGGEPTRSADPCQRTGMHPMKERLIISALATTRGHTYKVADLENRLRDAVGGVLPAFNGVLSAPAEVRVNPDQAGAGAATGEQLVIWARAECDPAGIDRDRLENQLRSAIDGVLTGADMALVGPQGVLVESDVMSDRSVASDRCSDPPMSFDGSIPPE
ncbi:MAG TPA: hypothetical protein VD866_29305 [Urbifossiella sp.]|nr:hypothetical protein [Urbifossiella sp.]